MKETNPTIFKNCKEMSGELTKRGNDFLCPQVKYGQLGRDEMK
jgi:hypothetical protein